VTRRRAQNPSAAAEQSTQAVEKSYSVTVENIRVLNVKMIEVARHLHVARSGSARAGRKVGWLHAPPYPGHGLFDRRLYVGLLAREPDPDLVVSLLDQLLGRLPRAS
jgi:hypothetical protein